MRSQRETREARRLLEIRPGSSVEGARDVRHLVRQAQMGGVLEPAMLLEIQDTLASGRHVKALFSRLGFQLSALSDLARPISELRPLEDEIARSVGPRGEMLDGASPMLGRLRSEIKVAHDRLIARLNEILSSPLGRLAVQEPIITVREGRYVLPVKADFKGQLRGVVHDTSASGVTLFVEPLSAVELNNRWREAQIDERREIERILKRLSSRVARLGAAITANVEALAAFDLALAKAKLAENMKAVEPEVSPIALQNSAGDGAPQREVPRPFIRLVNARHPLLSGEVVPTTVEVGKDFSILVITGPNTGGKTVVLKTAGLLTLMALAGLHVPADDGSRISVVDGVYVDIGDEQSIEQSLSTFSSHLGNIIQIMKVAGRRSLVLLDELGAGTDPTEGSALARAILAHLLQKGICTIATTHYNELKAFAHSTPDIENASVEFDLETLSPTYKLSIGLPGRSNALAIAARLGLPAEIITSAQGMISPTQIQVDSLLDAIQTERNEAEVSRQATDHRLAEVRKLEEELRHRLAGIDGERAKAVEDARENALDEVQDLLDQIREMVRHLQGSPSARMSMSQLGEARDKAVDAQREVAKRLKRPTPAAQIPRVDLTPIRPGDTVLVRSLRQLGEVVSETDAKGEVEVQLGAFRTKAKAEDLEKQSKRAARRDLAPPTSLAAPRDVSVSLQLDIRGRRADEVAQEVDQYLNDAFLTGLPYVRLIHGKGTGVLRQVIREQLTNHPLVRSFASAEDNDGGDGVTVAVLAH